MAHDLSDAYALLGLRPGASAEEVAAAYRARAKELHPDRSEEEQSASRMAAVNVAHDVLTAALLTGLAPGPTPPAHAPAPAAAAPQRPRRAGAWLSADLRRRLGPELLEDLSDGERVDAVTEAATWASPHTVLAVTERRLLWLLDDAVSARVRSVTFAQLQEVRCTVRGIRRRTGALRVRPRYGRPVTFTELPVDLAEAMGRRIDAGIAAAAPTRRPPTR